MANSPTFVLPRFSTGQIIAGANGAGDPLFIQIMNNAFSTITAQTATITAQEAALAEAVTQLQTVNAQVLAILTNNQTSTVIATVLISVSATGVA